MRTNSKRHAQLRAVMAFPAVSVALAISATLALTPLSPTQSMALTASSAPTETTAPAAGAAALPTTSPSPASIAKATPGPALPPAPPPPPASTEAIPGPTIAAPLPTLTTGPSSGGAVVVPNETLAPTGRTGVNYLLSPLVVVEPTPATADSPTLATADSAVIPPDAVSYALAVPSLDAPTIVPNIHGPYSMGTDKCQICHRSHSAKAPNLTTQSNRQSALCYSCHDGLGANTNVKEQFSDPLVPANNDATRMYYRHDTVAATATTAHISAGKNEFGGVSNRHSECGDCHNPHLANAAVTTTTPTGVEISGRLAGMSGVSVVNSITPGAAPTYTFLDGKTTATSITREYQLCFKCHSGFTTLSSNGSFGPSRYRLDKGIEFNPNNPSYHPVEAPGKNTTPAMTGSLAGGTTWKLTVNSTIRCVNCHASSTKAPVTPALNQPPPNGDLPMHTSRNPGILLAKYRNRVLMGPNEAYNSGNFALCYMCHSKTPFESSDTTATNFSEHERHVSKMDDGRRGSEGTPDIDTIGGGRGNALCAECHFRQHSTSFAIPGQTIPGSRLVSFSTNVGGARTWTKGETRSGSCTLTCHGQNHDEPSRYNYGP